MLKKIESGTAVAAEAMTVMVTGAFTGNGKGHRGGFDFLDIIEIDDDYDDGIDCD